MKLIFAALLGLGLLSAGLLGHVRTVKAEANRPEIPASSVPTATQRAARVLNWLNGELSFP